MRRIWRIFVAPLIVSGLLLSACGDDEPDGNPSTESDIIGTWKFDDMEIDLEINGQDFVDYVVEVFELSEEEAQELKDSFENSFEDFHGVELSFHSNKTFTSTGSEENTSGTWRILNDGKALELIEDDEVQIFQIESLTNNNLVLTFLEEDSSEDWDDDGQNETIRVSIFMSLSK